MVCAMAQQMSMRTYDFAVKDGDTLRIDRYFIEDSTVSVVPRKAVLYAFGGGFRGGVRYSEDYLPFFRALVRDGYEVFSTDYRTTLSGLSPESMNGMEGFVPALENAVSTAVADYLEATAFVVRHSAEWNIDPRGIVACGSSAGAITVLQAEYALCNGMCPPGLVPEGFNYAGVISFAGAVCAAGEPVWAQMPCPVMLFHGDADNIVPYRSAVAGGMGLWGSDFIGGQLKGIDAPCHIYRVQGAGHEIAGEPMHRNINDVLSFLDNMVCGGERRFIDTSDRRAGLGDYRTDFTVEDYIRANIGL